MNIRKIRRRTSGKHQKQKEIRIGGMKLPASLVAQFAAVHAEIYQRKCANKQSTPEQPF